MHRVVIDTNLLILLLVGTFDPAAIGRHRRTATFTAADFELLTRWLARYRVRLTTSPILAEASNLLGGAFHEAASESFIEICGAMIEVIHPKAEVLQAEAFPRLGFADASILLALDEDTAILTDDVNLYLQAAYEGRHAFNFNHLRRFDER